MFDRGTRSSQTSSGPLRHSAALGSLTCGVCGAGPFVQCDITTHQEHANAQYPCTVCGAEAGEVCYFDCAAADTLIQILIGVQPEVPQESVGAW